MISVQISPFADMNRLLPAKMRQFHKLVLCIQEFIQLFIQLFIFFVNEGYLQLNDCE